ncbi:MAG: beta-L-arabinofuranosidase domain-containing protein [Pirellulales bacterium]
MNASSKRSRRSAAAVIASVCGVVHGQGLDAHGAGERIKPVPISAVRLDDAFWTPRLELIRTVSIPAALAKCEKTGRIDNFVRAAAVLRGDADVDKRLPAYPFDDADVYKIVEAASYCLSAQPDAQLDAQLDALIAKIAAAQDKDGYLYTARTINPAEPHALAGAERWANEKTDSFELSNLGYLYHAAVAHFEATGKRPLLDVAIRSANLLDSTFGPGKRSIWPGHEGIEMGLVRLYSATGEKRYLDLAAYFLNERGPSADAAGQPAQTGRGRRGGRGNLNQSQQKVSEQATANGNAVDAANLYGGMADVAALSDATAFRDAVDNIWADVVGRKLYITGGIGATANDGAFGRNYQLPNATAASTTAASAANVLWNQRMFQLHGDGKYVDVLERTLYNALAAGLGFDGRYYFDANVLESLGRQQRQEWPATGGRRGNTAANPATRAASPIGMLRVMSALPGFVYATRGDALYVNLYAAGQADIKLPSGQSIKIVQETKYPWDGRVKLTLTPEQPVKLNLQVRIPGWARNEVVPSDLYRFADKNDESVALKLNGEPVAFEVKNGYASIERQWSAGDVVQLDLPMPVRRVKSIEQVTENVGRVALQRGPLVYSLEAGGFSPQKLRNLVLPDDAKCDTMLPEGGAWTFVTGKVTALYLDEEDQLVRTQRGFSAIPYHNWGNSGPGPREMLVWIPTIESMSAPIAAPNLAASAEISASPKLSGQAMNGQAAKDGLEMRSSHDNSPLSHFDWWPDRSVTVSCEYTWTRPQTIKQTQLYWWDDLTTGGGCKVPASWKALYKKGDEWVPVETSDTYGVAADQYNKVNFTPVETTALRLEIKIRDDASVGIQEWKVR